MPKVSCHIMVLLIVSVKVYKMKELLDYGLDYQHSIAV